MHFHIFLLCFDIRLMNAESRSRFLVLPSAVSYQFIYSIMLVNHVCIRNGSSMIKLDNWVFTSVYTFNTTTISVASWYLGWYTSYEKKKETVKDWIITLLYTMSLRQCVRRIRRKRMAYKELSEKDTPRNFQEIKYPYIAKIFRKNDLRTDVSQKKRDQWKRKTNVKEIKLTKSKE